MKIIDKIRSLFKPKVKIYVWDFDGTIFSSRQYAIELKKAYISFLEKKLKRKVDLNWFDKKTDEYGSWAKVSSETLKIPVKQIIEKVESNISRVSFAKKNKSLVDFINQIDGAHFIFSNGNQKDIIKTLQKMGFKKGKTGIDPFVKIIGYQQLTSLKPHPSSFNFLLGITQKKPQEHLMIGDSDYSDLAPARKIKMPAQHVDEFSYKGTSLRSLL